MFLEKTEVGILNFD